MIFSKNNSQITQIKSDNKAEKLKPNKKITILTINKIEDGFGGLIDQDEQGTTQIQIWAKADQLQSFVVQNKNQNIKKSLFSFTILHSAFANISYENKIIFEGKTFEIEQILHPQNTKSQGTYLTIIAGCVG